MSTFNWNRFVVRITVNASPKDLYLAWATRKGLEHWFLRLAEFKTAHGLLRPATSFIEPGDSYRWLWHGWPDETVELGNVTACNGKDQLCFTFGKAGDCTVTIKSVEGENMVELVQENIPDDETGMRNYHLGCKNGWSFYLANLKSVLEGGIDLRNKNDKITGVINS